LGRLGCQAKLCRIGQVCARRGRDPFLARRTEKQSQFPIGSVESLDWRRGKRAVGEVWRRASAGLLGLVVWCGTWRLVASERLGSGVAIRFGSDWCGCVHKFRVGRGGVPLAERRIFPPDARIARRRRQCGFPVGLGHLFSVGWTVDRSVTMEFLKITARVVGASGLLFGPHD